MLNQNKKLKIQKKFCAPSQCPWLAWITNHYRYNSRLISYYAPDTEIFFCLNVVKLVTERKVVKEVLPQNVT
jgi:hypothetical protein